jgi:hypothetical protein
MEIEYSKYLKGQKIEFQCGNLKLDFKNMISIDFKQKKRYKIQRNLKFNVNCMVRKNRFHLIPLEIISEKKTFQKNALLKSIKIEKFLGQSTVNGKYTFSERFIWKLPLNDMKLFITGLKKEIDSLVSYSKSSISVFSGILNSLNQKTLYPSVIKLYTMESFLYSLLNKILRERLEKEYFRIKYFYTSLMLACYHYSQISSKKLLDRVKDNRFITYMPGKISIKNIQRDKNSIYVINEFLSTTLNKKTALNYISKNNLKDYCLYEFFIPFDNDNVKAYVFLDEISFFPKEEEVLLKSGIGMILRNFRIEEELLIISVEVISCTIECYFQIFYEEPTKTEVNFDEFEMLNINDSFSCHGYLTELINKNKYIESINLSGNSIMQSRENLNLLFEAIFNHKNIKKLSLPSNLTKDLQGTIFFLNGIRNIILLSDIDFSNNNFPDPKLAIKFYKLIEKNLNLTKLDLSGNFRMNDFFQKKILFKALSVNTSITDINLTTNYIGVYPAIRDLCKMLKYNTILLSLNLSNNFETVDPYILIILSNCISKNTSLTRLDLNRSYFGFNKELVQQTLLMAMEKNKTISIQYNFSNDHMQSKKVKRSGF